MARQIGAMNEDLAIHQKMDDEPNDVGGLSAEELKERFDRAPLALQTYINEVLVQAINGLDVDVSALAEQLRNHVDIDPDNLTAENVGLLRELADRYGLTDKPAPTVHDALESMGGITNYLEHWWARRPGLSAASNIWRGEPFTPPSLNSASGREYAFAWSKYDAGYPVATVTYSDDVMLDENGVVRLKEPQTISSAPTTFEANIPIEVLHGKFVQVYNDPTHILFVCQGATLRKAGGPTGGTGVVNRTPYYFAASEVQEVFGSIDDRVWERIHNPDRNAYPDSGEHDDMEYRYMGIPVERLIDMMVEEATAE